MANAGHSAHEFWYLGHTHGRLPAEFPRNVECLRRGEPTRIGTQALLNLPWSRSLLGRSALARPLLGATVGLRGARFEDVDAWLWPHACTPVPRLGRPTITIVHDLINHHLPSAYSRRQLAIRRVAEASLNRCAALVSPSEATRDDLVARYPDLADRSYTFPEAPSEVLDPARHPEELAELKARFPGPFLLAVGVDWGNKNYELLLRVASELIDRRGEAGAPAFVLAGPRRTSRLAGMIRDAGLDGRVVELGSVSGPMLAALYSRALALTFPSTHEGFGMPLVEAMHYGLPILASDRSCMPEIVGDSGELLPADDPRPWADAIEPLLADRDHRDRMAARARAGASRYTWERTWRRLDEVFDHVLGGGQRATTDAADSPESSGVPPAGVTSE